LRIIGAGLTIVGSGLFALAPSVSRAQPSIGNDWVGKCVVQKKPKFTLELGKRIIEPQEQRLFQVMKVDGNQVLIHALRVDGWVASDQVVPVEQAIKYFTEYVRSHPDDAFGYEMRAFVLRDSKNDLHDALRDCDQAIQLEPASARLYSLRGTTRCELKQPEKAIADHNKAIKLDPTKAAFYLARAETWSLTNEFDKAIDDCNTAMLIDTKTVNADGTTKISPLVYGMRGTAWSFKKEFDKAILDFNELIRLEPNAVDARVARGYAWNAKKEFDRAIDDFNEAISLDHKQTDAYICRSVALLSKKDFDGAIGDCTRAIRLEPKRADAYLNRGHARLKKGEFDEGINDYSVAIRLDPKNASYFNYRATAWLTKNEHAKAIADWSEATGLEPKNPIPFQCRAWIWAACSDSNCRDGKKAVASASTACELTAWEDPGYLFTLAAAHAEAGDFAAAILWQSRAIELTPAEATKRYYRRWLRLYQNNKPYRDPSLRSVDDQSDAEIPCPFPT
jgi:tetratricopeptide (TPR) repeat protein